MRYAWFDVPLRRRIVIGAAIVVGLGVIWLAVTGYLAQRQARDLATRLRDVKVLVSQGDVAEARRLASDIPSMSTRLGRLTSGPAWWVGAHIPWLGSPLDSVRSLSAAAEDVGQRVVPTLITESTRLDPGALRVHGDTIRIEPLVRSLPGLEQVDAALSDAQHRLDDAPAHTWLSLVDDKRASLAAELSQLQGYVEAAVRAGRVLPTMLGADKPQTYFVGMQNEAELRGTGGLPGAYAIIRASHGTVRFTEFGSDSSLTAHGVHSQLPTGLDFGPDYNRAYGASDPTSSLIDSNVSPHFPYAAQIWAAMWKKVTGRTVDGVLALDPTTLSYFLRATGPVTASHHIEVTADNVVSLTGKDEYTLFPLNQDRKPFLVSVLRAAAHKITSGAGSPVQLLRALSLAGAQQRLLVWSRDPRIERTLDAAHYAGAIPVTTQPFSGLVLNNASGGKLDYYLTRSISYQRTGCGSSSDVLVTIALTDNAPASGLPPYVTDRLDPPPPGARVGDYRTILDYYATDGAQLQSVTLNGDPATASVEHAFGHPIFRMLVELRRGTTQTVVLHLSEPRGSAPPIIWRQPGITPLDVQVQDQPCG